MAPIVARPWVGCWAWEGGDPPATTCNNFRERPRPIGDLRRVCSAPPLRAAVAPLHHAMGDGRAAAPARWRPCECTCRSLVLLALATIGALTLAQLGGLGGLAHHGIVSAADVPFALPTAEPADSGSWEERSST